MSYKFIVLFAGLCTVEVTSSSPSDHIFDAEKNVEYGLNKPLEVGDIIQAWGVYRDHSTSKFSVNIKGQGGLYLLHVDFRPWNNVVVLNNYVYGWKTEIRPWFSKYNFLLNKLFEVKIEVYKEHYKIYFDGVELRRRFPHRVDISRADHVALLGGSNGFKWSALKLPNSDSARVMGVPFSTTTNEKNYLDLPLAVGDEFTAWGIYATGSVKFSVNLMMETEFHFMMHVDFRPPPNENKVVLNSKKENGWEREIRTPIPQFENGKVFSVTVVCLEGEFEIYHDNQVLGSRFPYRDGFKLDDVKFIWLHGGSRGMVWTDLAISQPRPDPEFAEPTVRATNQPKEPTASTELAGSVLSAESEVITSSTLSTTPGQQTEAPRPTCKEDEFTCRERCISSSWWCDGERDCIGGEDEEACDTTEDEIKSF